ncbi:HAMP domain-containing histidine kinase [Paenibacillus albidus]|uniref:sensor histidine kinase n=1 Tax=Paenibacillus albidus TaxID=2041023 RepID=UPI001BE7CC75|nr:HAMP domain-containing sensor histidine kinase [Paenibacillus albidus]MBT2291771.1 HAMP domain-containing histidine kinase [Paenibacillus albidus]
MIPRVTGLLRRMSAPKSLRKQLLAISLLILSGLLLLIGVLQYALMRNFIYSNRAESMETQMRSVPRELYYNLFNNVEPGGRRFGGERRPLLLDAHTTIAIYSSDGIFRDFQQETLSDAAAPRLSDEKYQQLQQATPDKATGNYELITAEDGSEHLAVFMNLGRPGNNKLLLQMSVNTGPLTDVIMQQLLIFAALSIVALLGGLFLYLPALRKTLVPLSNMGEAAQSIDSGNLNIRFPVAQGQSEIDQLSQSFNGMLERLEISFHNEREAKEQMRRFAADASHELRTPLTSIHGFLEVLLRGAADNKEQLYSALRSMHGESKRINKLVEDLLLLARMDGAPRLSLANLLLGEVIAEMQPHLLVLAGQRKVTFDISYGIRGNYDPDKIKQVILNLFSNAVQHTDAESGIIHVSLYAKGDHAELALRDNGSGISAEHLPHVFDRFYRSDSSRTRKYGGSGLGLSITKSIVEAHAGEISVSSSPGAGTVFKVSLPCLEGLAKPAGLKL